MIGYCPKTGHDLVKVLSLTTGIKHQYCKDCDQFYIENENGKLIQVDPRLSDDDKIRFKVIRQSKLLL